MKRTIARIVNRNLQATVLGGALSLLVAFALEMPGVPRDLRFAQMAMLAALYGLPAMLIIFGHQRRTELERLLARGIAISLALPIGAVVYLQCPKLMPVVVPLVLVVVAQVCAMRFLDAPSQA
ncbi:MAG TPA: hypothetical protein VMG11_13900 [Steroidobacteraceae bacterium]|nr:hypothetical protein [Steroidobacteraceae bacterium]